MAEISFGNKIPSRMYFGDKYVAKIYMGTQEVYNGIIIINIVKGNYVTKFYKSGASSVDLSSITIPKESKIYSSSSGSSIYIVCPDGSTKTYYVGYETDTDQWDYSYSVGYICQSDGTRIQAIPSSSASAYSLQDGQKLEFIATRALKQYNLFISKSGSGVGTIDPSKYSVYYGSTINPTASGSIGSGYAKFTITPPAEAPSQTVQTINIPVTVLALGDANFGYYYYSYSWSRNSFIMTTATTITVTGTQVTRTYTINVSSQEGVTLLPNTSQSNPVTTYTWSSVTPQTHIESDQTNVPKFFRVGDSGGTGDYKLYVGRLADSTPNMYGFDSWSTGTISLQEIGAYMQNNSSSTINVTANRKIVWSLTYDAGDGYILSNGNVGTENNTLETFTIPSGYGSWGSLAYVQLSALICKNGTLDSDAKRWEDFTMYVGDQHYCTKSIFTYGTVELYTNSRVGLQCNAKPINYYPFTVVVNKVYQP